MTPQARWDWIQSIGNVSVSPQREWELEQIKELFEEWGVHDPAEDEEENPLARRTYPMTVERDLAGPSVRKPVRAEQIDGTVKSEEQILSELYEHFLEQEKKNLASGIEYAKTIPPRYPPGGYLEFRGARILGEVWERLWRKAEADALQDVADRHAKRAFQSGPERQGDWHKVEEPISPATVFCLK